MMYNNERWNPPFAVFVNGVRLKIDGCLLFPASAERRFMFSPRGIYSRKRGEHMAFSVFLDVCTIVGAVVGVIGAVVGVISLAMYLVDRAKKK